jgi:hypothetical protein
MEFTSTILRERNLINHKDEDADEYLDYALHRSSKHSQLFSYQTQWEKAHFAIWVQMPKMQERVTKTQQVLVAVCPYAPPLYSCPF